MRFLHTADWHIGRTIRGRSRRDEFESVLAEVVEIARAEDVECIIVAGDIWDQRTASPESDRLVYETLRRCSDHGIQVVLLAGNGHVRRDIGVPFWLPAAAARDAVSIGVLERNDDGSLPESAAEFDAYVITESAERADPCKELAARGHDAVR